MEGWLGFSLAIGGALFVAWFVLVLLFTPAVNYHVRKAMDTSSPEFLHTIQTTCQSPLYHKNAATVFRNGDRFYPAMMEAIQSAQRSVCLECYIFEDGACGREFVKRLAERARAGVTVSVVVDAIGTPRWKSAAFDELLQAGGRIARYQTFKWYSLHRLNNRTHREILVVDGCVAFVGGAGIADRWAMATSQPQWRDTMVRLEGPIVAGIQAVFAENWLECCGEILSGEAFFPPLVPDGNATGFVVKSSPSDRATASRVAFQLLIESASKSIAINTPYFVPDRQLRAALIAAARRGVDIRVIVPGRLSDQRWVRIVSRRYYGRLFEAGIRIFEYQPGMIHAKLLVVDDLWGIVGTTNIDNRSFEHNDEVNVAMCDDDIAHRLLEEFQHDLRESAEVTLDAWRARPYWERLLGTGDWILERQQ